MILALTFGQGPLDFGDVGPIPDRLRRDVQLAREGASGHAHTEPADELFLLELLLERSHRLHRASMSLTRHGLPSFLC
jgi:hypothetical protein